ncbi:hypothetical protein WMY93_019837 [Mugilogobius chulae]|uniref:Inter-alpha-trypsin inhibitor heavy chain H3 n=1 Tax=Mugilogobius chulae TaxID=88201 RepID=A0AAW0NSM6_9GOBI
MWTVALIWLMCLISEQDGALVVSRRGAPIRQILNSVQFKVEVHSLTVDCTVTSRFAHTVMTSKALNKASSSQEIFFEMELPKTAFITNFSMEIDGQVYVGDVKEKEKAKKQYDKAVSSGHTAGLVKASGRKMEKFSVSVNIAASSYVVFTLTYEELLQRKLGKYEILTRVKPKQVVQEFKIVANIFEPQGLAFVETEASFLSNDLLPLVDKTVTDKKAHISFTPTEEQQRACPECEKSIISGDFAVKYDVKRERSLGEIEIFNGYFVHFFAPPDLPRVPVNVVFVIDRSGSMTTDIHSALQEAVSMLKDSREKNSLPQRSTDMIILLTDGNPNHGVSSIPVIQKNIQAAIAGKMSLFCLGFGNDVDYSFLDVMAKENLGGFYEEVSKPLLLDVALRYSDNAVMTQNHFRHLFDGSEIVVAGRLSDNSINDLMVEPSNDFQVQGQAHTQDWSVIFPDEEYMFEKFTERLWAYLTIQQLLDKSDIGSELEKKERKEKAMDMSLKYSFVTSVTSMVVTKPQTEDGRQQAERTRGSRRHWNGYDAVTSQLWPEPCNLSDMSSLVAQNTVYWKRGMTAVSSGVGYCGWSLGILDPHMFCFIFVCLLFDAICIVVKKFFWILHEFHICLPDCCLNNTCFKFYSYVLFSQKVEVHSLTVDCTVASRFAHTVMTSKALNKANSSQEIFFEMELPKTAFITNFSMEIDGQVYVGDVKEKEKAKKQYDKAVSSGHTAVLVKASGRKMEKFSVSVNIAASSYVVFTLTYEELLQRKLGKYEILTRVKPKQVVQEFKIVANIFEPQGLAFVETEASFLSNDLLPLVDKTVTDKKAHISFTPTEEQQRTCPGCDESIIDGDFIIKYDVKREKSLGEIQTREALQAILNDLHQDDHFALIIFDHKVKKWKKYLTKATSKNITDAHEFVKKIHDSGSTDIHSALQEAVSMLKDSREKNSVPQRSTDMIILLTDGNPNSGVSSIPVIQKNIQAAIAGKMSLFCLGFGNDVDYSFLDVMAKENLGVARRIFEGSDAAVQVQGFYEEVSKPLLLDVALTYSDNAVMSQNNFRHLFDGSEIVVAGRLSDNNMNDLMVEVFAKGSSNDFQVQDQANAEDWSVIYPDEQYIFGNFTERLWAYLTIQQLLEKSDIGTEQEKKESKEKALDMSLKYSFVTPLTSMVVTKPQTEDEADRTLVADKFTEDQRQQAERAQGSIPRQSPPPGATAALSPAQGSSAAQAPGRAVPKHRGGGGRGSSRGGGGGADGDPHFLIQLPEREDALCFNINDKPGTIFNLVRDPESGFAVNGEIIGKIVAGDEANMKTYFGRFGITHDSLGVRLDVSTEDISVTQDGQHIQLLWTNACVVQGPNVKIRLTSNGSLMVTIRHAVKFMVVKHAKVWKRRHDQQKYLGFYSLDSHHLSPSVHGLLGQFYHGLSFELTHPDEGESTMFVKGRELIVTRHYQKDLVWM